MRIIRRGLPLGSQIVYLFIMLNFCIWTFRIPGLLLSGAILLAGCAIQPDAPADVATPMVPPARDALHIPQQVRSLGLAHAPDGSHFAPVLTERVAYPTQPQAQNAFLRSQWTRIGFSQGGKGPVSPAMLAGPVYPVTSVRLFACRPGALDGQTGRMVRYRGPVVLCATEFLDEAGTRLWRAPINYYHHQNIWRMHDPDPPTAPVPWLHPGPSPARSWNPFGDRT
jgi:hypothetical protein